MIEFKINDLITLKLENAKTVIYVDGEAFEQCRFLLLVIPDGEIPKFEKINSIDEAAEMLDHGLEPESDTVDLYSNHIDPRTEFWAHCSNMQVWAEHDYDSRLLHSNLAFPLLKKLTELGDPIAKKRFKEEIGIRYFSGVESVRTFLEEEGYLEYLTKNEVRSFIKSGAEVLDELEIILGKELRITTIDTILLPVIIRNGEIVRLNLDKLNLKKLPDCIQNLKYLEVLDVYNNLLKELPNWIGKLKTLKHLKAVNNKIEVIPETIGELKLLKILELSNNNLKELPELIGNLSSIKELSLSSNHIEHLPESINQLKNLEILSIQKNIVKSIPYSIENLKALKSLDLAHNPISELPNSIVHLTSLENLYIEKTNIADNNGLIKKLKEKKVNIYL